MESKKSGLVLSLIAVAFMVIPGLAAAVTWDVNNFAYTDDSLCSGATPKCETVVAALAGVSAVDVIEVDGGAGTTDYVGPHSVPSPSFDGGTIRGVNGQPKLTGGMTMGGGLMNITLENLHLTGDGSQILLMGTTLEDLTIDDCLLDGEGTVGQHGVKGGGALVGDVTVTNTEFKDILAWALFESRSGSGGGGSPMDIVVFSNNYIHDSTPE